MLIVYTAAVGDTDRIQAPTVVVPGVTYLAFSDRRPPAPYDWIPWSPTPDGRLSSRRVKILVDHSALRAATVTLYHDAAYQLTGDLDWVERSLGQGTDLAAFWHHRHETIEEEAAAVVRRGFVPFERAARLVGTYRYEGFAGGGVTAGGLLVRRVSDRMTAFQETWWREVCRWRGRDQVSLDYAAWRTGIRIGSLPGWMRENPYARYTRPLSRAVA